MMAWEATVGADSHFSRSLQVCTKSSSLDSGQSVVLDSGMTATKHAVERLPVRPCGLLYVAPWGRAMSVE
jgi:hypothetical protein